MKLQQRRLTYRCYAANLRARAEKRPENEINEKLKKEQYKKYAIAWRFEILIFQEVIVERTRETSASESENRAKFSVNSSSLDRPS